MLSAKVFPTFCTMIEGINGDFLALDLGARARLEVQDRRLIDIIGSADPAAFFE